MGTFVRMQSNVVETPSPYQQYIQCTRKKAFPTAEKAFQAMESLKQTNYFKASDKPLEVYRCPFCFEFHFGHGKGPNLN